MTAYGLIDLTYAYYLKFAIYRRRAFIGTDIVDIGNNTELEVTVRFMFQFDL